MKLVFSPGPPEYAEESEAFKGLNGKYYYYQLEVNEEGDGCGTFIISDNCGRDMPFDFESLNDLVLILTKVQKYLGDKEQFNEYWNSIWNSGK